MLRSLSILVFFMAFLLLAAVATAQSDDEAVEPGFNEATFKGLALRSIGPAFMAGRISDIAIDPDDDSTWYVAVGSGGGLGMTAYLAWQRSTRIS